MYSYYIFICVQLGTYNLKNKNTCRYYLPFNINKVSNYIFKYSEYVNIIKIDANELFVSYEIKCGSHKHRRYLLIYEQININCYIPLPILFKNKLIDTKHTFFLRLKSKLPPTITKPYRRPIKSPYRIYLTPGAVFKFTVVLVHVGDDA